ncbi:hypothetical protein N2152v2_009356 [Parachlorella kessleri]
MTLPAFLNLSLEEESKLGQLQKEISPLIKDSPALQAFCTRSCYVRYLRARHWNVQKAAKMLAATLEWRSEYKPEALTCEGLAHEGSKGRMYVLPRPDKEGRPIVVMRPREDPNPSSNEDRIKWLVYVLEAASELADATEPGTMTWIIDYENYTRKASPPLKVSLQTLHILQNHYPERLGRAVCYHPPAIFDLLWRAVWPFIDPVTYKKVVFVNKKSPEGLMGSYFHLEGLDAALGGTATLQDIFSWQQYAAQMADRDSQRLLPGAGSGRQKQLQGKAEEADAIQAVGVGVPVVAGPQ